MPTKASDNEYPSILMEEAAAPANPSAGFVRLYVASADGEVHVRDSGGTEYVLAHLVSTTKGDLIGFDGTDEARLAAGTAGAYLTPDSGETTGLKWAPLPVEIGVACSDETTAITTGTAKVTFRMPHAMTLTAVRATLTTASTSGVVTVDINEGGTSVLSTKLTVDANEKTSTTAATAAVISDSALADDAEITVDVDAAGTGATGLKVWMIGTRA